MAELTEITVDEVFEEFGFREVGGILYEFHSEDKVVAYPIYARCRLFPKTIMLS